MLQFSNLVSPKVYLAALRTLFSWVYGFPWPWNTLDLVDIKWVSLAVLAWHSCPTAFDTAWNQCSAAIILSVSSYSGQAIEILLYHWKFLQLPIIEITLYILDVEVLLKGNLISWINYKFWEDVQYDGTISSSFSSERLQKWRWGYLNRRTDYRSFT